MLLRHWIVVLWSTTWYTASMLSEISSVQRSVLWLCWTLVRTANGLPYLMNKPFCKRKRPYTLWRCPILKPNEIYNVRNPTASSKNGWQIIIVTPGVRVQLEHVHSEILYKICTIAYLESQAVNVWIMATDNNNNNNNMEMYRI